MKTIVGLTGPTGAGKSVVSLVAKEYGINVIDCDIVARKAVEKGADGLSAVVDVFGSEILNHDGTLNRKALAKAAFCDTEHTNLLNKTLLPHIVKLIIGMITTDKTLLDAPTLFESGIDNICDKTIAVLADKNLRLERIIERDKIEREEALLRLNAGKGDEFYIEKADFVVYNNADIEKVKSEIRTILSNIFERN